MVHEIPRMATSSEVPQITTAEAEATARAAVKLFENWKFSDMAAREVLGGLTARMYERWKAGNPGHIDKDLATLLSLLMGIHRRLRYLFTNSKRGYDWIGKPNYVFGGRSPAEVIGQGDISSLARVRDYLDGERSGW